VLPERTISVGAAGRGKVGTLARGACKQRWLPSRNQRQQRPGPPQPGSFAFCTLPTRNWNSGELRYVSRCSARFLDPSRRQSWSSCALLRSRASTGRRWPAQWWAQCQVTVDRGGQRYGLRAASRSIPRTLPGTGRRQAEIADERRLDPGARAGYVAGSITTCWTHRAAAIAGVSLGGVCSER